MARCRGHRQNRSHRGSRNGYQTKNGVTKSQRLALWYIAPALSRITIATCSSQQPWQANERGSKARQRDCHQHILLRVRYTSSSGKRPTLAPPCWTSPDSFLKTVLYNRLCRTCVESRNSTTAAPEETRYLRDAPKGGCQQTREYTSNNAKISRNAVSALPSTTPLGLDFLFRTPTYFSGAFPAAISQASISSEKRLHFWMDDSSTVGWTILPLLIRRAPLRASDNVTEMPLP